MTDKENKRKCFKCGCSPAEDNIKLFRFPKPALKNLVRCELWAQYIFPERDYSSMSLQMKLHNEHRMLCQNHFKDKDFTDCTKQKLQRTAVPCDVPTMARLVKPKFVLRCCAPLCSNDADKVTKPTDISFHMFPDSPDLRKLWLDALDLNAWYEKNPEAMETALVCSEHFASADLYNTKTGFRKLRVGAVPLVIQESLEEEMLLDEGEELIEQLQVCRICLETEGRLIPMSQHKLGEIYQNLTGFSMSGDERLSQTFCPECAQRLRNFDRFREKSLTAELLLSNMLKSTESSIRGEFTKIEREKYGLPSNLVKLFINYDHFDLFIQEDTQNDHDQITNQSNIGDELTVLNFNTSDVKGASIKIDKLTRIAPKPNVPMNARLAPKPQAPIPNITPNLLQIAPKRNVTSNLMQLAPKTNMTANLRQIRPKLNATPVVHDKREIDTKVYKHTGNVQTRNANRQIDKNTVKRNESVQTTNMNKAIVENQAKVKKEFNTDNEEQTQRVNVDSLPVIDVVIDNKFKIVKKEELLLKNAQIIINNNKTTPIVQELDNNKAIVRNKYGVPIGVDLSKGSLTVRKQNQEVPAMTVLPIMTKDRIIMPNQAPPESMPTPHNRPKSMPQPILKNIQQDGMPILQNLLTTKQLQQVKPKTTPTERSKSISTNQIIKPKNIPTSDDDNRKKATIIRNRKDMPLIEKNQKSMPVIDDDQTEIDDNQMEIQKYEVPITNYEGQEFCEETVVTEDYLDMQSESDTEMNTENEVENMIKKEKDSSNANTDSQIESLNEDNATEYNEDENNEMWEEKLENDETWDENQENNETWDENQENDVTWDVKQENDVTWDGNQENDDTWDEVENTEIWNENSGKWEAEEFSEDNENEQNSDTEQQNDEIPESDNKVDRLDPDTLKKNRMQRKRKSVQLTYGKTYFSDDLNDVIFTIKQLNYEEQLAEIRNRLLTKYKDAAYTCDLCYRGFMHEYAYHRHMGLHDSDDGEFECGVCRFKFRTAKLLECHQAARHATKFSCNLCDFTTTSTEPARQHGTKHRGIRYQCPDCSEECIRYTVLMDHMVIKHTPENLCPVCGLKLVSHEELERHKSVRHEAQSDPNQWESAVHCDRCDILFASEDAYRFHLGVSLKHDSEFISEHQKAKRNQEEYFLKPSSQYKKTEVTGPLTCEQCGMILPTLRKYHAHFRRDHPDKTRTFYPTMKKKVMCELCGRFFKAQWQYVEHLRLHTNERPYSCEHCGKTFITNRLLCAHRYIHNARRTRPDIRCKLCGKNFANKGNLHRHMGVHSDEKRFKCEICNTAYRQKAEMKSHYDHVHLRKPWPKRHRPKRDASTSQTKSVPTSEDDTSQQYVVEEVAEEMEIGY